MADSAISIIVEKLVEYTVGPILHQLGYLYYYNKNIKDFEGKCEELVNVENRLRHVVIEARGKGYEIEPDVSKWLDRAKEFTTEPHQSQGNVSGSDPSCFNLVQRHQQSRKAKKTMEKISEIIEEGKKFDTVDKVGHPVPLTGIGNSTVPENYQFFESRTLMAKQIKDALANPNVNKVGVCGMGGVGKTYLLNEVEKLVMEDKSLFDQVIKVLIGQTLSVEDIQTQISDKLRLDLNKLAKSKQGRAVLLRNKLEIENKILVMLDDLWNELDLEDVGIPCRSNSSEKGCKILITSRNQNVLTNNMNVEKCFLLNSLDEDESWKMFVAITGEINNADIEHVAKEVANKCGRLPLALDTIAKALKGKALPIWKDALNQLKNPIASNIEGVTDEVYSSLKWSYNHIKSKEARSLFLLCSVFPDDYLISVERLQMYAMGMRLLNGVHTWDDSKNRVVKLVDDLISYSLLLEADDDSVRDKKFVKMHDVVRDVAIHIASSKEANMPTLNYGYNLTEWREEDRSGSYKAIFSDCRKFQNLPQNLQFPNLELLILQGGWMREKLQISNTFFEGMEKLKVLDLSWMRFQELRISLAHTLVILCLERCEVNDIDIIGELKKLEILRIDNCSITCLPATMNGLAQLKVLQVSSCNDLKVIPQNVLSSMTKLEELDLSYNFFYRWGQEVSYKDKLIKNATLSELKYLPHLISLKLEILDERMLHDFLFLEKLKLQDFRFRVGDSTEFGFSNCARSLSLGISSQFDLINQAFGTLWEKCESLYIEASSKCLTNFQFKTNENGCQSLRQENSENVIPVFDDKVGFLELKELRIEKVNNVEMFWHNNHGLIANSFRKLETMHISDCNSLRYILSSNVVISLVSLNSLYIESCESIERIFEMEEPTFKQKDDAKVMPLMELNLIKLPKLKCVWSKDPSGFLTFPNLQRIYVSGCPQLQSVLPASFINHVQKIESLSILIFSKGVAHQIFSEDKTSKLEFPEIVFPSLRSLKVCHLTESFWFRSVSFPRLQNLRLLCCNNGDDMIAFPLEMNQTLYDIEELDVSFASKLVHVFPNEEENDQTRKCANLKKLFLCRLPELTHVWRGSTRITLSNLNFLTVVDCGKLMNLLSPSIAKSLVKLKRMSIRGCKEMGCIVAREEGEEDIDEIVFSQLLKLELKGLPSLASFHSGKCKLGFPCLEELIVDECPTMNRLSHGIINTPQLRHLQINYREVPQLPKDDINVIFQDIWLEDTISSIKYLFAPQNEEEDSEDSTSCEDER